MQDALPTEHAELIAPTGRNRLRPSCTRLRVDPLTESYDPSPNATTPVNDH